MTSKDGGPKRLFIPLSTPKYVSFKALRLTKTVPPKKIFVYGLFVFFKAHQNQ